MDEQLRIYLTKRPETMKFMGGYYVFPGGALEESDELSDRVINQTSIDDSFHHAHYIAAARELFEEVGVFLGGRDDGSFPLFKKHSDWEYRRLLISYEISFHELLEMEDLYLYIDSLQYFGHLTTPSSSPIRFDTRFFLAHLPEGQTPHPEENEIDDAFWIKPSDAIQAHQMKKILLSAPTVASLHAINDYQQGKPLKMPALQNFRL